MSTETSIVKELEKIVAARYDYIPTLESRGCDELDFPEVSVWGLKELLLAAYNLGKNEGK